MKFIPGELQSFGHMLFRSGYDIPQSSSIPDTSYIGPTGRYSERDNPNKPLGYTPSFNPIRPQAQSMVNPKPQDQSQNIKSLYKQTPALVNPPTPEGPQKTANPLGIANPYMLPYFNMNTRTPNIIKY